MKIKYVGPDGLKEDEKEAVKIEFYGRVDWRNDEPISSLRCTDLDGRLFHLDLPQVVHITDGNIPIKPTDFDEAGCSVAGYCRKCNYRVYSDENYCSKCGQKLDWSEV